MLARWGELVARRRWLMLVLGLAVVVVGAVWGGRVGDDLSGGGWDTPGSTSQRAAQRIEREFPDERTDVIAVFSDPHHTVTDPAFRRAVEESLNGLPKGAVKSAKTYWTTKSPVFVSHDRHSTFAALRLDAPDADSAKDVFGRIKSDFHASGVRLGLTGHAVVMDDVGTLTKRDTSRAETLSAPLLLLLLVLIFGGLAAASMPLAIGALAVLGSFTVLRALAHFTDVSVFSLNIVTMLGLGLAIDYALFVVGRFREELAAGRPTPDAVRETMATAGRTVAFSGVTVAVSIGSLVIFPQGFLRSMGYGGVAAVGIAMLASLTVLPALLALLGPRINSLRVPLPKGKRGGEGAVEDGRWFRAARAVMRRPLRVAVPVVVVLVALGLPFLKASWGGVTEKVLPEHTGSRVAGERLDRDFAPNLTSPMTVVVTFGDGRPAPEQLTAYAHRLAQVPGADGAQVTAVHGDSALIQVGYSAYPMSKQARDLVTGVRGVPAPAHSDALVGGPTAALVDQLDSLAAHLPWMALVAVLATMALLFLAFGSLVLPLKAVLMNALSLFAAFGVVVWVFQEGHGDGLLGFTATGTIDASQPILMLAVLFGLSMDYEVFLLARMREHWDATGDAVNSVAVGVQRSARIITSAALLLVVVVAAFSTSGISFVKMIGVGMAVAIVLDVTVVRLLLMPAALRLLGRAAWWAPAPLARWWERHGVRETDARPSVSGDSRPQPLASGQPEPPAAGAEPLSQPSSSARTPA
ncbi:MMPL family transporter [Streptomyces sp. NPDC007971]|uniref:MMPL family transporter n=1 Tax=Streptomyces sp. NPDC007971 TaxID=3364799 RepID=UPI0036E07CDD